MINNEADPSTTDSRIRFVPFDEVHAEMVKKAEWAKLCMPQVWERFIAIMESKTFTLDEITRQGKRMKNLMGSVEEHRKAFMQAVEDSFDMDVSSEKRIT